MRVQPDSQAVREILIDALPREFLWFVSINPGVTLLQTVSAALKWLPLSTQPQKIRGVTRAILGDLETRGDLSRAPGGRYFAIPPLAVECISPVANGMFRLFGNPLLDADARDRLKEAGGHLRYGETTCGEGEEPALLDRSIECERGCVGVVADALSRLRYGVLLRKELSARLPKISDVSVPPAASFYRMEMLPKYWESYACSWAGRPQWVEVESPNELGLMLLRWHDEEYARESHSVDYYLSGGPGLLYAISAESAILWQLRLDADWGKPAAVRMDRGTLRVPLPLPRVHKHWLQAQSPAVVVREGGYLVAHLDSRSLASVTLALHESLGLVVEGDVGGTP